MAFVPLFSERQTDPADLQIVLDELALAERLESHRPPESGEITAEMVRFYLEIYQEAMLTPTPSITARATATA